MSPDNQLFKTLVHTVNPTDTGGEHITITTKVYKNEDGSKYTEQVIGLESYCNSVSMHLHGAQITPQFLRKMADDLEKALKTRGT